MKLIELKQAAKRLQKRSASIFPGNTLDLAYQDALEAVSRLHGYRNYHEAQQRLAKSAGDGDVPASRAKRSSKKPHYGLVPISHPTGLTEPPPFERVPELAIFGPHGAGKSLLMKEFALSALADGQPVRIVDPTGEYRHFTKMLGGQYLSDAASSEFQTAWNSTAVLVVVGQADAADAIDCEQLKGMPKSSLFLWDDAPSDCASLHVQKCLSITQDPKAHPRTAHESLTFKPDAGRRAWEYHSAREQNGMVLEHLLCESRSSIFCGTLGG